MVQLDSFVACIQFYDDCGGVVLFIFQSIGTASSFATLFTININRCLKWKKWKKCLNYRNENCFTFDRYGTTFVAEVLIEKSLIFFPFSVDIKKTETISNRFLNKTRFGRFNLFPVVRSMPHQRYNTSVANLL